jgi:hypothetical protein
LLKGKGKEFGKVCRNCVQSKPGPFDSYMNINKRTTGENFRMTLKVVFRKMLTV